MTLSDGYMAVRYPAGVWTHAMREEGTMPLCCDGLSKRPAVVEVTRDEIDCVACMAVLGIPARCEEQNTRKATGLVRCNEPLDRYGQCPMARDHER